jgi:hypothetical protein
MNLNATRNCSPMRTVHDGIAEQRLPSVAHYNLDPRGRLDQAR